MSLFLRKLSNSLGEVGVTVGTTTDGGAPAGTGVAFVRGAARAGVVRPGGTGGDGQEYVRRDRADRELVRRRQVGREYNVRKHSHNHSLLRGDDLDGPRVTGRRLPRRVLVLDRLLEEP